MRAALFALVAALAPASAMAGERIVTLGAAVTEIVFALGAGGEVVGVDGSSLYPAAADALPEVGAHRRVDVESVLKLRPTLVMASADIGPPEALDQLQAAGVEVVRLPPAVDVAGATARITAIADRLDRGDAGRDLADRLRAAITSTVHDDTPPRVAFLYARGAGTLLLGGRGAGVDVVVEAAGAELVTPWEGFRPVTAEALVTLQPDLLLLTTRGLESLGGVDGLLAVPGVALTPAARARAVVAVDDLLLLGLGPRTGLAVELLRTSLPDGGAP